MLFASFVLSKCLDPSSIVVPDYNEEKSYGTYYEAVAKDPFQAFVSCPKLILSNNKHNMILKGLYNVGDRKVASSTYMTLINDKIPGIGTFSEITTIADIDNTQLKLPFSYLNFISTVVYTKEGPDGYSEIIFHQCLNLGFKHFNLIQYYVKEKPNSKDQARFKAKILELNLEFTEKQLHAFDYTNCE